MKRKAGLLMLFVCALTHLNAQDISQRKTEKLTKRELVKDLHTTPFDMNFKGVVIFDGRLLEKGFASISLIPVDTIRTITYITPDNVPKSLLSIAPNCQYGIFVLDTSTDPPALPINVSNIESIILNFKIPLYKNTSNEPF